MYKTAVNINVVYLRGFTSSITIKDFDDEDEALARLINTQIEADLPSEHQAVTFAKVIFIVVHSCKICVHNSFRSYLVTVWRSYTTKAMCLG
ncbi:hypothetical protein GCM10027293_31200 [Pontibacter aydingkolensis]